MPNAITDIRYIYLIRCITKFPIHVQINGMHASVCARNGKAWEARNEQPICKCKVPSALMQQLLSLRLFLTLSLTRSLRVQEESIRLTASCYTCTCCSWVNAALKNYQAPTRASTHIHFYILIYNSNLNREYLKFVTSRIIYLCLNMYMLWIFLCGGYKWLLSLFIFLDI